MVVNICNVLKLFERFIMTELEKSVFIKIVELQRNILILEQNSLVYEETLSVINDGLDRLIKLVDADESETDNYTDNQLEDIFVNNIPKAADSSVSVPFADDTDETVLSSVTAAYPTNIDDAALEENSDDTFTTDVNEIVVQKDVQSDDVVVDSHQEETEVIDDVNDNHSDYSYSFSGTNTNAEQPVQEKVTGGENNIDFAESNEKTAKIEETVSAKPKVDEVLSRHVSKDIYKAFTINDKFRYRKALFGNSAAQYNEALDLISQMNSYDQAADYFLNNYGWNPEDNEVKGFLKILEHHFNA